MSTRAERNQIYCTTRWRKLREKILNKHGGLCAECEQNGLTTEAKIIHHIIPWKEGETQAERLELVWDEENLMPVCEDCHSALHFNMDDVNVQSKQINALMCDLLGITKG